MLVMMLRLELVGSLCSDRIYTAQVGWILNASHANGSIEARQVLWKHTSWKHIPPQFQTPFCNTNCLLDYLKKKKPRWYTLYKGKAIFGLKSDTFGPTFGDFPFGWFRFSPFSGCPPDGWLDANRDAELKHFGILELRFGYFSLWGHLPLACQLNQNKTRDQLGEFLYFIRWASVYKH